jgi:hypothetical protein
MAKDAFGNDTAGEAGSPSPTARPVPGPAAQDIAKTGRDGLPGGVLLLVLVVLSLAGSAFVLVREERANRDDPVQAAQRGEISMLDGRSLLRTANLERAWAAARGEMTDTDVVLDLRVTPVGLVATVRDADEQQRDIVIDVAFDVRSSDRGESARDGVRAADVPTRAVERAVRGVLGRAAPGAQVESVRASITLPGADVSASLVEWTLDVTGVRLAGRTWFASPDGSRVRLPAEPRELTRGPTA